LAEALVIEGRAVGLADPTVAAEALRAATVAAFAGRLDALGVEAWARRAWLQGTNGKPDAARAGPDGIEAIAARTPTAPRARALLHNTLGTIELGQGRRAEARAEFEAAQREASGVTGPGALELSTIPLNLALVDDDPARSDALYASAHAELARLLGA